MTLNDPTNAHSKGTVMKLIIAILLLCIAATSRASNFADFAAMNESGITTTQTAGVTRTDVAAFFPLSADKRRV
jgi:lactate dehydrogenase-like 2-hydroxyacid dehydrogenase